MTMYTFDKASFFKTLITFLLLSACWTFQCIRWEYDETLTGTGFLITLMMSFAYGQPHRNISIHLRLLVLTSMVFLASLGLLFLLREISRSLLLNLFIHALFVAWTMYCILNYLYTIQFRNATISITTLMLCCSDYLISRWNSPHFQYYDLLHFNAFQLFMLLPLSSAFALKKQPS